MIFFVAPAYNEEQNIGRLIERTHAYCQSQKINYELIVVDDGSADNTATIVRELSSRFPCHLVSYKPNRGVDEAFRRGFHETLKRASAGDIIVTMESDGTADFSLLGPFLEKINS